MPAELWQRFRRFSVLEPDPVARRILVSRVGAGRVQFEHRDLLLEPLLSGKPGLDGLLEVRPRASVLFCNLLGQLHWQLSDREQSRFRAEFRRRWLPLLHGRPWASFHDRWSLDCSAGEAGPQTMRFGCAPSDHELGVAWFGASGPTVTVLDHGTLALFPEALPRSYFSWQITPHARHIVEGVAA